MIPTSNHSSAQHPHPKACEAVIRPTAAQGHRTKPKHKLKQQHKQHLGLGGRREGERTESKLNQTGKKIAVGEDTMDVCTGGVSFAVLTILVLLLLCG